MLDSVHMMSVQTTYKVMISYWLSLRKKNNVKLSPEFDISEFNQDVIEDFTYLQGRLVMFVSARWMF